MPHFTNTRQLVLTALFAAIGCVLHLAESFLPIFPVPGAKLGLANIALLFCLYLLPLHLTVMVFLLRLLLVGLLTGSFLSSAFFIAFCGGGASLLGMLIAKKLPHVSIAGVSLAGAAAHNTGQVLAASYIISNSALFYYLPLALLFSFPAGLFTGFVARAGLSALKLVNKETFRQ